MFHILLSLLLVALSSLGSVAGLLAGLRRPTVSQSGRAAACGQMAALMRSVAGGFLIYGATTVGSGVADVEAYIVETYTTSPAFQSEGFTTAMLAVPPRPTASSHTGVSFVDRSEERTEARSRDHDRERVEARAKHHRHSSSRSRGEAGADEEYGDEEHEKNGDEEHADKVAAEEDESVKVDELTEQAEKRLPPPTQISREELHQLATVPAASSRASAAAFPEGRGQHDEGGGGGADGSTAPTDGAITPMAGRNDRLHGQIGHPGLPLQYTAN